MGRQKKGLFVKVSEAHDYLPNPDHLGFIAAKMLLDSPPSINYKVTYSVIKPGGYADEHSHSWDHAYYIIKGRARVKVGDEEREVSDETLIYVPPNILHSVKNIAGEPLVVLAVVSPESKYNVEKKGE